MPKLIRISVTADPRTPVDDTRQGLPACKITQMMWPSQRLADKYLGTSGAHVGPSPGLSSSPSRKLRPLQRTYADYRGSGLLPLHVLDCRSMSSHTVCLLLTTSWSNFTPYVCSNL